MPTTSRQLLARPHRWWGWGPLSTRLCSGRLDRQLAAGVDPLSSRALAARAGQITAPERRRRLADDWLHLLEVSRRQAASGPRAVTVCRDRILEAQSEIAALLVALARPGLVGARGVAMATLLLSDGSGPLFNRRSRLELGAVLEAVTAGLDVLA